MIPIHVFNFGRKFTEFNSDYFGRQIFFIIFGQLIFLGIIGMMWASLLHYKGFQNVTISEPADPRRKIVQNLELNFNVINPNQITNEGKSDEKKALTFLDTILMDPYIPFQKSLLVGKF